VEGDAQTRANTRMWARTDLVGAYNNRDLRAAEVIVLLRYREGLSGRVLELGCGAGRLSGFLAEVAREVHAIDVSPAMVAACRRAYPSVQAEQGDLRDLGGFGDGSFDAVAAGYSVLDVLTDDERRKAFAELRRIVASGGLLVFSSHNRDAGPDSPMTQARQSWREAVKTAMRMPRWLGNRRRLVPLQREEPGYAVFNDSSHDYGALHYYITRNEQEQQLKEAGFSLIECLDLEGQKVSPADTSSSGELHYVAR
jgi:SAM-dependent methyltransferase